MLLSACAPAPAESADAQPPSADGPALPVAQQAAGIPDGCLPASVDGEWVETGRTADAGATYLMLEPAGDGADPIFNPVVARLAGGTCESYLMWVTDGGSDTDMVPPGRDAMNRLLDGSFAWHAAQSGGVEAYADIQREYNGGVLNECPPDEDLGACILTWMAERFRAAGVEVGIDS